MAKLPQGTVTFLFTDIEGSTQLVRRLGDRYGEALDAHHRIIRDAAEARGGSEVDNQGDSFFFAFSRANAALGAAVVAQRQLAAHAWPDDAGVRVRMGLHTGEPAIGPGRYVGIGVHRAARVGAAAHGGQVLLSAATRELVEERVDDVTVRELGMYLLKDMERPERLYQVDIAGLQTEFPPLRAQKVARPNPMRRRAMLLAAVVAGLAATVPILVFALDQGGVRKASAAIGDSVAFVDPATGELSDDVSVGASPTAITQGAGAVWVADTTDGTIDRVDPVTHTVRQTIRVGAGPAALTVGDGSIWVANALSNTISRIDPGTNSVVATIRVGNEPRGIVYVRNQIWVATSGDATTTRIDAATGKEVGVSDIAATDFAVGCGGVWASERAANRVVRVDPGSGDVLATIPVGNGPAGIACGAGAVWVANSLDGTVSRIDPNTSAVTETIRTGNGAGDVAVVRGRVWVADTFDGALLELDADTGRVLRRLLVGDEPNAVALVGNSLALSVGQSGRRHRGGTLRVDAGIAGIGTIDPAVAYSATSALVLRMTGDGLVAFDQVPGLDGTALVPDLALSLPAPTDGGRTYAFRLRSGIRYSTGRPVRASDVRTTFERLYKIGKLPVTYYDVIDGAALCRRTPKKCDLSRGIIVDDAARTVTFHLAAPDPDFLYQLGLPFGYVLPAGTPDRDMGSTPLPATGPYRIAHYRPNDKLVLTRNRFFREWSHAAQPDGFPDRIVMSVGHSAGEAVRLVVRGRSDALTGVGGEPPPAMIEQVATRFAGRVRSNPSLSLNAFFLNTDVPPFDRLGVRRALNYAVDRSSFVRMLGGPRVAASTCQILPPGLPGYRAYCPYHYDLPKARALVAASGTRGMPVTVWGLRPARTYTDYAAHVLRTLGYRVKLKLFATPAQYFPAAYDPAARAQIGFFVWATDYPVASGFIQQTLTCAAKAEGAAGSNPARFCDPAIDRDVARAVSLEPNDPPAAWRVWSRVDRELVDSAPLVPLTTRQVVSVLGKRVGNFQYNPVWWLLVDQLWVR